MTYSGCYRTGICRIVRKLARLLPQVAFEVKLKSLSWHGDFAVFLHLWVASLRLMTCSVVTCAGMFLNFA